ncbi:MAG: hypothetical protein AAF629_31740 [Chloroflexota bacterium]
MIQKPLFVTQSMQRLLDLFEQIEDEDVREIISATVMIESKHRSSSRKNFPMQSVRDAVDAIARQKK